MRQFVLVYCLGLVACAAHTSQRPSASVVNPALQREIAERVAADQAVQHDLSARMQAGLALGPADYARRDAVFDANLEWMRALLARHGWPGRRLVGEDGSHGAWLLLQHADKDAALQRRALELLERAVRAGDASARDYAYLLDRVRVGEARPQVYGTQLRYDSFGCASLEPTEAPAELDARRASVGLGPASEYVRATMTALGRAAQCANSK